MKTKKTFFATLFAIIFTSFAACTSEDIPGGGEDKPETPDSIWYNITSVTTLGRNEYANKLIEEAVPASARTYAQLFLPNLLVSIPKDATFSIYNFDYKSKIGEETITMSGQLIVPLHNGTLHRKGLVVDNRFTVLKNDEVPTKKLNIGASLVLSGMPVVTCDMLGYGSSVDKPLSYYCHHVSSRCTVDAAMAAVCIMKSDWMNLGFDKDAAVSVYNEGYSQGGYGALSLLRYMEKEATDQEKAALSIKKTACGASAYDPRVYIKSIFEAPAYPYYAYMAAGLASFATFHPECFDKGFNPNDLFTEKAKSAKLLEAVASKQYNTDDVCKLLAATLGTLTPAPGDVFIPEVLNPETPIYKSIMAAAALEDLTKDWRPSTPLYFFHATNDEAVPVACTLAAQQVLGTGANNNIEYDVKEVTKILDIITVSGIPGHMLGYFNFILGTTLKDLNSDGEKHWD